MLALSLNAHWRTTKDGGPHALGLSIFKLILPPVSMLSHEVKDSLHKTAGVFSAEMLATWKILVGQGEFSSARVPLLSKIK